MSKGRDSVKGRDRQWTGAGVQKRQGRSRVKGKAGAEVGWVKDRDRSTGVGRGMERAGTDGEAWAGQGWGRSNCRARGRTGQGQNWAGAGMAALLRQGLGALSWPLSRGWVPGEVFGTTGTAQPTQDPASGQGPAMAGTRNPQPPAAILGSLLPSKPSGDSRAWDLPTRAARTDGDAVGPAMEVRSNPKNACSGGQGLRQAMVPPCRAHRNSCISRNGPVLQLGPQAHGCVDWGEGAWGGGDTPGHHSPSLACRSFSSSA